MPHAELFIVLGAIFGFFMAWGIGANDVANAMGLSVGSRSITIKQAILIAAIFEASGALFAGGQVTQTIRSGIIDIYSLNANPEIYVYGMLASLLAAGTWLLVASYYGWPVSTTHSIVGAIIGFAVIELGVNSVYWGKVTNIVLSWIVTPLIAATLAYLLFLSLQRFIFNRRDPVHSAKKAVPYYTFLTFVVVVLVTLTKGLKHLGIQFDTIGYVSLTVLISLFFSIIASLWVRFLTLKKKDDKQFYFANVEKIFGVLMLFTACAMAFSHGANDVANAIGPLAGIVAVSSKGAITGAKATLPIWILALGAVGIVIGLAMYGWRVIATVGEHITELTPSRGFAAGLSTATTVILASGFGLPVSTTQTLVGAVLGVGFARGMAALNLNVIRNIFMSWIITLPVGALLCILYFTVIKFIFS